MLGLGVVGSPMHQDQDPTRHGLSPGWDREAAGARDRGQAGPFRHLAAREVPVGAGTGLGQRLGDKGHPQVSVPRAVGIWCQPSTHGAKG